jgi:hypothetical protein
VYIQGLNMFPAMVIVPTMQIAWTLFSITSGMLYFQEYDGFNALKGTMFAFGVLVSVHLAVTRKLARLSFTLVHLTARGSKNTRQATRHGRIAADRLWRSRSADSQQLHEPWQVRSCCRWRQGQAGI